MQTRTLTLFVVGLCMGLALSVSSAHAENRPAGELNLFTQLNGVQQRDLNPSTFTADGGGLTLFSADAGPGCQTVKTGAVYEMHCSTAGHFCPWFDGGVSCGSTLNAVTYGRPVAASSPGDPRPFFFVAPGDSTAGTTTNVCIAPKSGDTSMLCALFRMK